MTKEEQIEIQLLEFLRNSIPQSNSLGIDTELIDSGLLDSLLLMDVVVFVESNWNIQLGANSISPNNFRNLLSLAEMIRALQSKKAA